MDAAGTTERADIVAIGERSIVDLISHPPTPPEHTAISVHMTSGTSGGHPIVVAYDRSPEEPARLPWHTVVVAIGARCTRSHFVLRILSESEPRRVLAIDGQDLEEGLGGLMDDLSPDGICGSPALGLRMGQLMSPEAAERIAFTQLTGAQFLPALQAAYHERFPDNSVQLLYGASEVGYIGTQDCGRLQVNCYHPAPRVEIDIDRPDEQGIGDILITKTFFRDVRVERYRIGDLGKQHTEKCGCGKPFFEFIGRDGFDRVKVAGALLLREEFDRVAEQCEDLFGDYRAEGYERIDNGRLKGGVTLTVFARGHADDTLRSRIARRFSEELYLTPTRTLSQLASEGLFLPLVVEFSDGPFPKKNKDIKVRLRTA